MANRKQRFLQDLYNATQTLSHPEITPILRGNCWMQGPVDDSDCDFHTNTVPSQVDREYSSYLKNSDWRAESGTCNVCSAPCSSCLHINQCGMGTKVDECSGEASAKNVLSFSVNNEFPNEKLVTCETVRKYKTGNFASGVSSDTFKIVASRGVSSDTSKNVDCEASRNSDLSATSNDISVFRKVEDLKGQEDHDHYRSCVSGAQDTNLSNFSVRNEDGMNFPSYPVSANSPSAQKNVKTVGHQTFSHCLDVICDSNERRSNSSKQLKNRENFIKQLPLSVCSQADLSSKNLGLVETLSEAAEDVTHLVKVQGNFLHPAVVLRRYIDKSSLRDPSTDDLEDNLLECPSGHLTSPSTKAIASVPTHSDPEMDTVDTVEKNGGIDKVMGSQSMPDAKENSFESHPMDESDDSDMVEHDVKVCDICGDAGREDLLAICCRCSDGAEHTYCMREMVDKVPVSDWLCEECKFDVEINNQRQEKVCSVDGNEKINSSGQANSENANFFTKSEAKGLDILGSHNGNDPPSVKILGKRHSDDTEVPCAAKKRVLESDIDSAKVSTSSGTAAISPDISFRQLHKGKAKPTQHSSSGTLSAHDTATSPSSSRLHIPQDTFVKSYSFNSLNVKPKVKLVDDFVPQKHRSVRGYASLDMKEGAARSMTKSMSFRTTNSGCQNIGESKVKMLAPKFCHIQETKGSKHTKDRNLFERKYSFKSERMSVNPPMANPSALAVKIYQKLVSSDEPNSLSSARNFHDIKGVQSESRSMILSKSSSFAARTGSDLPVTLGELKRQSSTGASGTSSLNGSSGHDMKPNQGSPKEDSSSNSYFVERQQCNLNEGLPDGLSRASWPKESTNFSERAKDSMWSQSRQISMVSGRILSCRKCKEIGHLAQFCTADHPVSPAPDASAAKNPRETVEGKDKLKAAIEAAVLRKPGIYRKHWVSGQCDDASLSNINSEIATQDQLLDLSNKGNVSASGEMQEGQIILGNFTTDSTKTVEDNVKQFPVLSIETSTSRTGGVFPINGSSLVREVPNGVSAVTSTLLKTFAIPDHEYIWQGVFEINRIGKPLIFFDGIQAHLSTFASPKVLESVNKFAYKVLLNEVPRLSMWPVQFQEYGVKEDNVAIFFFAKDLASYEKSYKVLLDNMMKYDLALKGNFDGFELMIFPSNQLPEKSQRWNALFFLWGVFRGKRADCSRVLCSDSQTFISQGSSKSLASEVAVSEMPCLSPSQALKQGCDGRVSSEVTNNDPVLSVEQQDNKEDGVDSEHKIEQEFQTSAESTRRVGGFSKSQEMMMDQNSHFSRQCASHYFGESPACAGGIGSMRNIGVGDISDKTSSSRYQVSLEDGSLNEASSCGIGNEIVKDNYRNRLFVDSVQRMPHATYASRSQVKSGIAVDDVCVEEVSTSKKQKTNVQTSSSIEGLVTQIHGGHSESPIQGTGVDEAFDGFDICEIKGNAERYFFPVDTDTGKDVGLVGKFIPRKMSPLEEDGLQDRAPNLELALGAESKPMTQDTPTFLVGKEDRKIVRDNCSIEAATEGDEDDISASLSLSLSFPFPDKEQTMKSCQIMNN